MRVELKTGVCNPVSDVVRVRAEPSGVLLNISGKTIKLNTIKAHRIGFDLVKKAAEAMPSEFLTIKIGAASNIDLLPDHARQIGAALLKKADILDDYQQRVVI